MLSMQPPIQVAKYLLPCVWFPPDTGVDVYRRAINILRIIAADGSNTFAYGCSNASRNTAASQPGGYDCSHLRGERITAFLPLFRPVLSCATSEPPEV
jgi:hypothetical protein